MSSDEKQEKTQQSVVYIQVEDRRAEGDLNTCLRPLGLCELGGCCDSCWYNPEHPRFKIDQKNSD